MVFNIVWFKVKVVFFVEMFFVVFFRCVKVNFYNCKFFVFFLSVRCVYIFILKFSNLSISESSLVLMSDTSKDIDMNVFSKLKGNGIRFVIVTLYSMFAMLTFFWDIGF